MRPELRALAFGTALAACAATADAVAQTPAPTEAASALTARIVPEPADADRSTAEPGEPSAAHGERVGPAATSLLARAQLSLLEPEHARPEPAPLLQRRDRKRQTGVTLMIVGGAAFVTGLVIGDTGGTLLAVAGIGVGAYGLYLFVE